CKPNDSKQSDTRFGE
ncbi:bacterial regulatory s, gntR family protein, partial [Vibrio parahaemolyticus V-223/04]